ncbi:exopolysaccharide biosynthesis polyprenyl glycosylphosphotransferase [Pseudobutyrivibrio sp. 49]|uniref:sugar transferase n=1 Tax=Pseudobutyrivibrio sp. 49 TaxID=1855344 RepID=UPI00087F89DD|nr:sugar transferase [Pseudobutyrivibrio sp. 49]SDI03491.1 exopolysaccharide biosynthesis polyprenyl glycosylphosphotransferase [Pseudobutyrivibrio sp. 49]
MYKKKKKFWAKHWDIILLDTIAALLAMIIALFFRFERILFWDVIPHEYIYENIMIMIVFASVLNAALRDPYTGIVHRNKWQELKAVVIHSFVNLCGILIFLYAFRYSNRISRVVILSWFVLMVFIMFAVRIVFKRIVRVRKHDDSLKSSMLVIADSSTINHCLSQLAASDYVEYKVVGCAIIDKDWVGKKIQGVPVVGDCDSVFEYIRTHVVDEVFIDGKNRYSEELLAERLTDLGCTVHISLIHTEHLMKNRAIEYYGDYITMTTSMHMATNREAFCKRTIDILGSLVGLLISAVAFVFIAPVIKIQAPGPVFFSQTRIGKNGRRFKFYKFRSMYTDAEERKKELMDQNEMNGLMFKMENDPRIFPAGHFIRKYSIDELPQFWNVLIGDMSLVGTRPPTENEFVQYELHHKARLASRPGLTGMWQVSGRSDITDFEEVVALDTEYIKNWSLGLDLQIILKTIAVVLKGSGSK